ncbi:hypothetical protein CDL12_03810 [Handroanthus impetiginosus]|uniref:Uncharacterized protein n=1 Tax=Handroanthus impetiginosus TaxID=429701 RepID=A0A2G9I117_9LAMI|nr:hypothetical protein CDL12_23213 [Handroanthus impetiginosus]PIN23465.1 hypothetical protein CDL12_03810 [Handroanthus impetiginosus]
MVMATVKKGKPDSRENVMPAVMAVEENGWASICIFKIMLAL